MSTTDTVEFPTPAQPQASTTAISLGMSCMVFTVLILVYCGEYVFRWFPKVDDVFASVKVHVPMTSQFLLEHGWVLWVLVAVAAVLSVIQTIRKPGQPRTVAIQVATFISGLFLVILVNEATWGTLAKLMQGIGSEK